MHNKKVFTGCMIRHGALLLAEAILALAVSVILVQGNKIISGVKCCQAGKSCLAAFCCNF